MVTIPLNMDPIPVTNKFIRDYKKKHLDQLRQESSLLPRVLADSLKAIEKTDISYLFGDHLPFFKEMLVNEDGNILIFPPGICLDDCTGYFQFFAKYDYFWENFVSIEFYFLIKPIHSAYSLRKLRDFSRENIIF